MTVLQRFLFTCVVILSVAACAANGRRSGAPPQTIDAAPPWQYVELDDELSGTEDPCGGVVPPSDMVEIRVQRHGGCLGFYLPPDSPGGPVYLTGSCAEYTLTLRADGSAEYLGREHVPLLGMHRGKIAPEVFQRLARLADEIDFNKWADRYPETTPETGWVGVTMDGEGPVVVTARSAQRSKTIEFDPNRHSPVWLRVFTTEVDRIGENIEWSMLKTVR